MSPPHPSGPTLRALENTLADILAPLQNRLITRDRITEVRLIANGGFGEVHEAELREQPGSPTFVSVAVKKLFPQGEDHERIELSAAFARELKTWAATDHPNILPLTDFFLDAKSAVALFISPFMPNGSIRTYLRRATPNLAKRVELATDISDGLAYLHAQTPPICHGDIKPNNVVINADLRAMLCDFGLARVVQDHPSGLTTIGFDEAGTLPYLSPELVHVAGTRRNAKTDTWAYGGVLLEVLTDEQPYKKCSTFLIPGKLKEGTLPAPLDDLPVSARMQSLLRRCWEKEPGSRADMSECSRELRLERSTLGDVGALTPPVVLEDDAVPISLIQTLAALTPYRMSQDVIKFDHPEAVQTERWYIHTLTSVVSARLHGAFRTSADGTAIGVSKIRLGGERRERLEQAEKWARQISIWVGLNHPNIYPLLGFFFAEDFGELWLIGPWNDSLWRYISEVKPSRARRIQLAIDIAQGLRYLQVQSPVVIHGSLYHHKVAVGLTGQAMIGDFASAVILESSRPGPTIPRPYSGFSDYFAPEVEGSRSLSFASEAWSFGCLVTEVFLGHWIPVGRVANGQDYVPPWRDFSTLPEDLRQLILHCFKYNPDERPTIQQCLDVLTNLLQQETQIPSPLVQAPAEESSNEHRSALDVSDGEVGTGTHGDLTVREDIDVLQPEVQPPPSFVQASSAEGLAKGHDSALGTPDGDVGTGIHGGLAVREEVTQDWEAEQEAQSGGCGCRPTCVIQ